MSGLVTTLQASDTPLLWLDDAAYTERLLANGHTPWLDSGEYVAYRRKVQGLLAADVRAVPLTDFLRAWAKSHEALVSSMAAKSRPVFPARTLLADDALRAHLVETLAGLRSAFADAPLVLALPSPCAMVRFAWQLAFGENAEVEVGGDETDSCAVYLAEFLRSFESVGVDALLLEEATGAGPVTAERLDWYQPVLNVARHYRWDIGIQLPAGVDAEDGLSALSFVVGAQAWEGAVHVVRVPERFWETGTLENARDGQHRFATVPPDGVPETVLERLSALRGN